MMHISTTKAFKSCSQTKPDRVLSTKISNRHESRSALATVHTVLCTYYSKRYSPGSHAGKINVSHFMPVLHGKTTQKFVQNFLTNSQEAHRKGSHVASSYGNATLKLELALLMTSDFEKEP
jgi:hypothetical protein